MERPEGCRFWTADDVARWIGMNVPHEQLENLGHKSVEQAALWWLAYETASMMLDTMRVKDLAEMLQEGVPALTPEDIDKECQATHEDNDTEGDPDFVKEADETMESRLKIFWHV